MDFYGHLIIQRTDLMITTSSWNVNNCRTLFISIKDVFLTGLCATRDLKLRLSHRNVGVKCQIRYVLLDTFNCFSRIFSDWQKGLKHIRLCVKLIILWLYIVLSRSCWRVWNKNPILIRLWRSQLYLLKKQTILMTKRTWE